MSCNSKIALFLAFALATPSAAIAGPKHAVRHQLTVQQQVPPGTYLYIGSRTTTPVRSTGPANQANNISARGLERLERLIKDVEDIGLREDLGS